RLQGSGPFTSNGLLLGSFIATQVLCFAAAGATWSLLQRRLLQRTLQRAPHLSLRNGMLPYMHAALTAGLHLLGLLICLPLALQLVSLPSGSTALFVAIGEPLAWCALVALALAALLSGWDEAYRAGTHCLLFACGLLALGLVTQSLPLT